MGRHESHPDEHNGEVHRAYVIFEHDSREHDLDLRPAAALLVGTGSSPSGS